MGFFSDLLKGQAQKLVTDLVEKAVDSLESNDSREAAPAQTSYAESRNPEERLRSRLENVIARSYPGYQLQQNVPATVMGADASAADYSYGVYENGTPKLFIHVIVNRNDYSRKRFRMGKEAAERNGVAHFNFFSHLPNEESYIVKRLSEVL